MAKLYSNENFPRQTVEFLRRLGHDVLTVSEAGNAGLAISDPDVLAFAIREQRAVITLNRRDFINLHYHTESHTGIVVCSANPDHEQHANQIHQALVDNPQLDRRLIRVNRGDVRVEVKPMLFPPSPGKPGDEDLTDAM